MTVCGCSAERMQQAWVGLCKTPGYVYKQKTLRVVLHQQGGAGSSAKRTDGGGGSFRILKMARMGPGWIRFVGIAVSSACREQQRRQREKADGARHQPIGHQRHDAKRPRRQQGCRQPEARRIARVVNKALLSTRQSTWQTPPTRLCDDSANRESDEKNIPDSKILAAKKSRRFNGSVFLHQRDNISDLQVIAQRKHALGTTGVLDKMGGTTEKRRSLANMVWRM